MKPFILFCAWLNDIRSAQTAANVLCWLFCCSPQRCRSTHAGRRRSLKTGHPYKWRGENSGCYSLKRTERMQSARSGRNLKRQLSLNHFTFSERKCTIFIFFKVNYDYNKRALYTEACISEYVHRYGHAINKAFHCSSAQSILLCNWKELIKKPLTLKYPNKQNHLDICTR